MRAVRIPLGAEPMTWGWGRGRAAIVLGLLLSSCLACSSSDPIESANLNVPVVASASPAYAGMYQWARLQLDQITLRPVDAQANAYLQIPLGLVRSFSSLDARATTPTAVASAPLRAGTYQVEAIRIAEINLNVSNTAATASTVVCSNGELAEARTGSVIILQFPDPPLVQVAQDGSSEVNVVIDGPAFVNMLLNQPYQCGGVFPTPTPAELAQVISVN
ncbi:MAG TPA: hypothetical protein VFV75_01060 [Candidatus Polarisedimenticolaceae bacterium]|nr:hypothetical protein [Candidatus Polarisedimenticolaceae bacterium]